MKPCPNCGCPHQKLAFTVAPGRLALACMKCEWTGPFAEITYPPARQSQNHAAALWNEAVDYVASQQKRRFA